MIGTKDVDFDSEGMVSKKGSEKCLTEPCSANSCPHLNVKVKVHLRARPVTGRRRARVFKKKKKKKTSRACRCCWSEGREVRFRFQPGGGSGGRTAVSPIYEDPYRGRWT